MTPEERRQAARKWLEDPQGGGKLSAEEIKGLAGRLRLTMLGGHFDDGKEAAELLAQTIETAGRIKARQEKKE